MFVKILAKLLQGITALASIFFGQAACKGLKTDTNPLCKHKLQINSLQSQVHISSVPPALSPYATLSQNSHAAYQNPCPLWSELTNPALAQRNSKGTPHTDPQVLSLFLPVPYLYLLMWPLEACGAYPPRPISSELLYFNFCHLLVF